MFNSGEFIEHKGKKYLIETFGMEFNQHELKRYRLGLVEYHEPLEPRAIYNGDFSSDVWEWAANKTPIDTRAKLTNLSEPFLIRPDLTIALRDIMLFGQDDPTYKNLPSKVFFNDKKKATTLMFGEKATVVKAGKGDEYSKRVGFLEAYFQATCGLSKTQAKKYLERIVEENEK